jgi:acetyl-CoA carboxylase carboxyltransferase component
MQYQWTQANLDDYRFLSPLKPLFGSNARIEIFFDRGVSFDRLAADGIVGVRGKVKGRTVSALFTDFRVGGGSFGQANMDRTHAFLREIHEHEGCLVFILNTLGARFTEGRSLFNSVFQIIPALYEYAKRHPYFAIANGKALGLGAIFFGQAQYRIATSDDTLINLTGPEVLTQFFGQNHQFDQFASAGHQLRTNSLVHEVTDTLETAIGRIKTLIAYPLYTTSDSIQSTLTPDPSRPRYMKSERELVRILSSFSTHAVELFPQLSEVARVFVVESGGQPIGIIMNPPLHPNNMLSVKAVEKSQAAMELFARLRLPMISLIDSPGGDPRPSESDEDAIMKMIHLVHTMIDYPYGKMGVITHRCYGGACMFAFPKIFGGERSLILEGSKIGIISEAIVEKLIENTPRMKEEWDRTKAKQTPDLADMKAAGTIDRIIPLASLRTEVSSFLAATASLREPPAPRTQPVLLRLPKPKVLLQLQPSSARTASASVVEDMTKRSRRSPRTYSPSDQ